MMFQWKPDMIRFMKDASEYGSYYRELSQVILPYLNMDSHICDAGCGLGYLSLELAHAAGKVTSIDINNDALNVLRENCSKYGTENIDVVCGDIFSMSPTEKFSAMVFCYVGDISTVLEKYDTLCCGPIFLFMRNYELHKFSLGRINNGFDGYEETCRKLEMLDIPYKTIELENEFGQPFRNMEDAKTFFNLYRQDPGQDDITNLLLLDRITYTGRDDFPLYMPYMKKTGCIIINPQDTLLKNIIKENIK